MSRYINSADALNTLKQLAYETALNQFDFDTAEVFEDLAKNRLETWVDLIPTADVVEVQRWIPVTERLPEEDEVIYNSIGIKGERQRSDRVLAIDSTGFIHCGYFIKSCKRHEYHGNGKKNEYSDNGTASWEFGDHYDFNPNNWIVPVNASIVAWMPLPEPYREEATNAQLD